MRFVMSKAIHPTRFLEHTLWWAPLPQKAMHADLFCLAMSAGFTVCLDSFTIERARAMLCAGGFLQGESPARGPGRMSAAQDSCSVQVAPRHIVSP